MFHSENNRFEFSSSAYRNASTPESVPNKTFWIRRSKLCKRRKNFKHFATFKAFKNPVDTLSIDNSAQNIC